MKSSIGPNGGDVNSGCKPSRLIVFRRSLLDLELVEQTP